MEKTANTNTLVAEVLIRKERDVVGLRPFLRRLFSSRLATFGAAIIALLIIGAIFAPLLTPYSPVAQDSRATFLSPSLDHPLGTDDLGRDVWSRVLFGSRVSLQVGIVTVLLALVMGVPLGLAAGYMGRWVDSVIMRVMDALLSFPALVLALGIAAALGSGLTNAMIAISIINVPTFARLVRGQTLSVREREFIQAARTIGASDWRIVFRHVFPNVTEPIIVQGSLTVAFAIIIEASLSYLGVGQAPPAPTWGSMLRFGYQFMQMAPWLAISPGLAILLAVLAFNFLGDGIRDALDPRLRPTGKMPGRE